jgi:hypothetical protein
MSNPFTTKDPLFDIINQVMLGEKKLTDAEMKKREEIAQAMERDNPGMDMGKKMAIATAQAKKVAEEVEQIDEVGNTLKGQIGLRDYKEKAKKDMGDAGEKLWYKSVSDKDTKGKMALIRQRDKRRKGIQRADARIKTEEVNLDEHLENFWEAYTTMFNEAEDQQQNMLLRAMAKDPTDLMKMKRAIKMGDKALTNPALRQEILAMLDKMMTLTTSDKSLLQRTRSGFQKAKTMKMPEEVEQIDELSKKTLGSYIKKATYNAQTPNKNPKSNTLVHAALRARPEPMGGTERPYGAKKHVTAIHKRVKGIETAADKLTREEVQLEAIGAKDKQDEGEYGYEGDMAMSQLRTIIRNSEEMMKVLKKDTDLPEWVQSKITLATDYLQTANDYLMSELEEEVELDEADEKEVGKEIKVARLKKDSSDFMARRTDLFPRSATSLTKHLAKKDDEKYGEAMKKVKDTPVSKFVASRKGDGKVRTEEAEKAPFEGGREVKSSKPAAMRVKKIAKGMQKLNTPKDKK